MEKSVQSILIHRNIENKCNIDRLEDYMYILRNLGYEPIKLHITKNYYRFRINEPSIYKRFQTKRINDMVSIVYGYKK